MNSLENFDVDIEVKKQIDSGLAWSVLFVISVKIFLQHLDHCDNEYRCRQKYRPR